jgi:excinuclease UvrABC ATPase subunit
MKILVTKKYIQSVTCFDCGTIDEKVITVRPRFGEIIPCVDCNSHNTHLGLKEFKNETECEHCKGSGKILDIFTNWLSGEETIHTCNNCSGTGFISEKEIIKQETKRQDTYDFFEKDLAEWNYFNNRK